MADRKPVIPRSLARQDVEAAVAHYLHEGQASAAMAFIDALETAFTQLRRHPQAGSPRYAIELDIPGLRSWPIAKFPHLVFYIERTDHIDVWRVLHGRRDIPSWMHDQT